jgi:hypothetical protein
VGEGKEDPTRTHRDETATQGPHPSPPSPPSPPPPPPGLLSRAIAFLEKDVLGSAKTLLGLAALVIYGFVRIGLDAFYNTLGIRAEDVGLTQLVIISRAAMGFVLALFIGALLMVLIAVSLSSSLQRLLDASTASQEDQPGKQLLADATAFFYVIAWIGVVVVALCLFGAAILIREEIAPLPIERLTPFLRTALTIVLGLALALMVMRPIGLKTLELYADAIRNPSPTMALRIRSFRSVTIVTSILLTAALAFLPWASGYTIANDVMMGKPYIPRYVVGLPAVGSLDVRAECVMVKQKASGDVVDEKIAPNRVLYLGRGDDFLIFYRTGVGPLRLPAGDFILTSITASTC